MSEIDMTKLELEYEQVFNIRDQPILFMKACPTGHGFLEELLATVEELREDLYARL